TAMPYVQPRGGLRDDARWGPAGILCGDRVHAAARSLETSDAARGCDRETFRTRAVRRAARAQAPAGDRSTHERRARRAAPTYDGTVRSAFVLRAFVGSDPTNDSPSRRASSGSNEKTV